MKITITPEMLCELCGGKFTHEACEAICEYYEEFASEAAPAIGDIMCCFAEMAVEDVEEGDDDCVVAVLSNGNVVCER